jgi:hypothetical protein
VRILFYTDDFSVELGYATSFGVGRLRDLVVGHNTFHADFQVSLVQRHAGGHAANKLTPALLADYDQVWVFGVRQTNQAGEPENELTAAEVAALRQWMDAGGGLLVTGDHSNPNPVDPNGPYLNLGRALGRAIPRAGELRKWEGPPDAGTVDNHNTQVPDGVLQLDNLALQGDGLPQQLILKRYPVGWIWPWWVQRYRPHPLFCGRNGAIGVFPDHMHEGQLVIPASFPAADWPGGPGGQPIPEIVSWGTDKRNGAVYAITAAYDGELAGVGRIVADSTWHHYFNINLAGFANPSPTLDTIADYYVNLAVWLSPPAVRAQMRCWFWWRLASHPAVRMVAGNPLHIIGATALDALGRRTSSCLITQFVWPWPIRIEERERFPWPPEELVLGGVLARYQEAFRTAVSDPQREPVPAVELVRAGVLAAVEEHAEQFRRAATGARELLPDVRRRFEVAGEGVAD